MKVIDLINMMNNEEDLPEKMIINKRNFHSNVFRSMIYEEDCNTDIWMAIKLQHIDLDDTVTVIEDNTIDIDSIEELSYETVIETLGAPDCFKGNELYCLKTLSKNDENLIHYNAKNHKKINELIQAVKQLNKEIKDLKER